MAIGDNESKATVAQGANPREFTPVGCTHPAMGKDWDDKGEII